MKLIVKTDGGSRGNPGPSAIGFVIYDHLFNVLCREGVYIGHSTNNQAEYTALLKALQKCCEIQGSNTNTEIDCRMDSALIVNQLNGSYKVKDSKLIPLFMEIIKFRSRFKSIFFTHIPREQNKEADQMVNLALDKHLSKLS